MLGNSAYNFDHQPLPEAASQAAFESIKKRGFPPEGYLKNYSISTLNNKEYPLKLNALAFAHSTYRNLGEYASFTVFNAPINQRHEDVTILDSLLVSHLAESSAPFHLIHRNEKFSFWASAFSNNEIHPIPIQLEISYDQLDNVLSDYSIDLKPQRIIDVKQGRDTFTLPIFRDIHPLQLSFWAAEVTGDLLVEHFTLAVEKLRKYARHHRELPIYDSPITSLSIQLLGAIILADTGVLGDDLRLQDVSLSQLIEEAQKKFPNYFRRDLFEEYYHGAEEAYVLLRQIRFAGFTPDMLTRIYSAAYSKEQSKKLGRFDTPLYITRRIWENIPVEYLPPKQRFIADMTCGWGSFLISAHERLSNLTDTPRPLNEYLRGNDIDFFTAQLAGLGLLLSTSEDSWNIDHGDALEWKWLNNQQPNIIVGNPPFGADRKSLVGKETRYQVADRFLSYAIERLAPNGYLAMLMPSSFMGAEASPILRKQLLEMCDVLELWELPTEVFPPDIAVQTVVVFAQKNAEFRYSSHTPVRVRTVQKNTRESFKNSGVFTASGLVIDQSIWNEKAKKSKNSENTHIIDYRITLPEYTWREIKSHCIDLHNLSEVFLGAIEGKKLENKRWTNYPHPRQVPWLTTVKDVIKRPFFIDYEKATSITYPNDLEEPRKNEKHPNRDKEKYLEGTKILLASDPHPTWGRVVNVAIERKGHFVSNSFWVIVPTAYAQHLDITYEVLAAILNWHVSNAWVISFLRYPWIPERAVNTIPIPKDLSKEDCRDLTELVRIIEEATSANKPIPLIVIQAMDTILKAAYHLDEVTFERLRKITEWNSKSEITLDIQPDRDKANWLLSGIVDSINAEEGTITFWLEDFAELQTVQIVPSMPGWMLRVNATFRTKIPREYIRQGYIAKDAVKWNIFHPQPYAYMSEEELLEELTNVLHRDEKNRI
ncbi:MAG: class I SAM-dependent DNA methyltransferase [Ktedonobacteraceae bacterium]